MPDIYDNPLGTDGFEFVEFTSPDPRARWSKAVRDAGLHGVSRAPLQERAPLQARATSTSSSTWSPPASPRRFAACTAAPGERAWRSG